MNEIVIYMYRNIITKSIKDEQDYATKSFTIQEYPEVIDDIQDFVFTNIQELVEVSLKQTDF